MKTTQPLLKKLLLSGNGKSRLWTALLAMTVGTTLLLIAVLIWWNFNELLHGGNKNDSLGSTFLTISRRVTNVNMGHPEQTTFSKNDIDALKKVPEVEDVGIVQSLKPKAYMSMQIAAGQGFSTVMVLEAVPNNFMDKMPEEWHWQPGNVQVPIILSSSFLSLYNYAFAPSQGLPQLSEETIKALPFKMAVGNDGHEETYVARIVGFSDRITSVLVPETFVQEANRSAGFPNEEAASRLVVKIKDPSATAFNEYLSKQDYITNSEQLRWSRIRAIVQIVSGATGVMALLLMGISVLVFILFIELTVARAQDAVRLLLQLGYSPKYLSAFLYKRFLPLLLGAVGISVFIAFAAQIGAVIWGKTQLLSLSWIPGWPMWLVAAGSLCLLLLQLRMAVSKALANI